SAQEGVSRAPQRGEQVRPRLRVGGRRPFRRNGRGLRRLAGEAVLPTAGHQRLSGAVALARPEGREEPIRRRLLPLRPPLAQRLPQGTGALVLALLDEDAVALAPQLGERAAGGAGREVAWVGAEAEA